MRKRAGEGKNETNIGKKERIERNRKENKREKEIKTEERKDK